MALLCMMRFMCCYKREIWQIEVEQETAQNYL